jgi:hypothetical protein
MPEMNVVGKPYEGKLHVRFDAAGDGKGFAGATYHSLTLPSLVGTEGDYSKRALLPPKRVIPCAVWGIPSIVGHYSSDKLFRRLDAFGGMISYPVTILFPSGVMV